MLRVGRPGFNSRQERRFSFSAIASRSIQVSTQPPIEWRPGSVSLKVQWSVHKADAAPPPSTEVINVWSCTSTPQYVFMVWWLIKHRDNFTFTLQQNYIYIRVPPRGKAAEKWSWPRTSSLPYKNSTDEETLPRFSTAPIVQQQQL
jgi:hypothetical protein